MIRIVPLALAAPLALCASMTSAAIVDPIVFDFGALAEESKVDHNGRELQWGASDHASGYTVGDLTVNVSERAHLDGGFTSGRFESAPSGLGYCDIEDCNKSDFDGVRDAADLLVVTFDRVVDIFWTIRETTQPFRDGTAPDHTLANGCARVNGVDHDLSGGSFVVSPGPSDSFSFAGCSPDSGFGISDFYVTSATVEAAPSPVPLPAGALLLGTALAGLGLGSRRKA